MDFDNLFEDESCWSSDQYQIFQTCQLFSNFKIFKKIVCYKNEWKLHGSYELPKERQSSLETTNAKPRVNEKLRKVTKQSN